MSPSMSVELNMQVQELLERGFIKESTISCTILIVLVPTKGVEWQMCTNFKAVDKIIIRYQLLLLQMDDLLDCLSGSIFLLKIDLKSRSLD